MTTYLHPQPAERPACATDALACYRARDLRISIGLPIKQDNGEYEYPGYVDGVLIGFYSTPTHADLALNNILDAASIVECYPPDGGCSVHNPCDAHLVIAAQYLAGQNVEAITAIAGSAWFEDEDLPF